MFRRRGVRTDGSCSMESPGQLDPLLEQCCTLFRVPSCSARDERAEAVFDRKYKPNTSCFLSTQVSFSLPITSSAMDSHTPAPLPCMMESSLQAFGTAHVAAGVGRLTPLVLSVGAGSYVTTTQVPRPLLSCMGLTRTHRAVLGASCSTSRLVLESPTWDTATLE